LGDKRLAVLDALHGAAGAVAIEKPREKWETRNKARGVRGRIPDLHQDQRGSEKYLGKHSKI